MAKYFQIEFREISSEQSDILVAELSQIGFEGFEEKEGLLLAFIPAESMNEALLKELADRKNISYHQSFVEETNWNAAWESNFHPVIVGDFAAIRADFHDPIKEVKNEIIITPKMSFGTGHHATTLMMVQQMGKINFSGKSVVDFGTGTGVLAILAEKLGATEILAIDHDEWSISNAAENLDRNHCKHIILEKAESLQGEESFDIILANINKNVILENFSSLAKKLSPGGKLLLSGLLIEDEQAVQTEAEKFSLKNSGKMNDRGWLCIQFDQ